MNNSLPLIVANLKANKTWDQMSQWLDLVGPRSNSFPGTVVVCPSYAFLASSSQKVKVANWKLKLGSQDLSHFEQGAYTGEVTASQIADLVEYSIVGHSERRQNFDEDEISLGKKVENAKKVGIEPIYCIQSPDDRIPSDINIVAYEPFFAIGTGNPDTPQNIQKIARKVKETNKVQVIYGGSVSAENVNVFLLKDLVDGVLVGATNSLDPNKFIQILEAVSK